MMEQAAPNDGSPSNAFPDFNFKGTLRPSQQDVVKIAQEKLAEGKRHLHIVAPPGSGKTVLGLYLWACCIKRPAVVFSPNSAIQAQWAARIDLFESQQKTPDTLTVSTNPLGPGLLTSLTYQSVTMPKRGDEDLDSQATDLWKERLIEKEEAKDLEEATIWVEDLKQHNPNYFEDRLKAYRKEVRDTAAKQGDAMDQLHLSSKETLERLRQQNVGLIILDECHHLMGHWGRVLADARDFLDQPIVIGLTATPPDRGGKSTEDITRYDEFFGPIDYEVPVPAVVKDGFLAPYQDLAFFVRPTHEELAFVANADDRLHEIVELLCQTQETAGEQHVCVESLVDWVSRVLGEFRLPTGIVKDWLSFERRDTEFAKMGRIFLKRRGIALPAKVADVVLDIKPEEVPEMAVLIPVLDRYVRHRLRRSEDEKDHQLAETVIRRLRTLGVQITETGSLACASTVGRVLAYSQNKTNALVPILKAEYEVLGEEIRAVIITDFEKTSATNPEVQHLLDQETGGAIAAFKTIVSNVECDRLDPILVTGSSVLIDDDIEERFTTEAKQWLQERNVQVELIFHEEEGFHVLTGKGADWSPRIYVSMITDLFQRGVTKCLVGTRGLLGEGWDANKINVLVDLTTVTTSMSVNQLRGRSIRLDPDVPTKLANNWDVVCIAPEFSKGLDDYERFRKKHQTLFGITDDGLIEKGVGHVHAAFTELKPEGIEGSVSALNDDMFKRIPKRNHARELWKIGDPYQAESIRALEVRPFRPNQKTGFPPVGNINTPWTGRSLTLAIGEAVLASLLEAKLLSAKRKLHVSQRDGGYVRAFLEKASEAETQLFTDALHEAMGPLHRPRYLIPRSIDHLHDTWFSKLLPSVIGQYFQQRKQNVAMIHAVPSVLAKNKKLAKIYEKNWQKHVSPGEIVYGLNESGLKLIDQATLQQQLPNSEIHDKEIFL